MPPLTIVPPKRSLGIFAGLSGLLAQRAAEKEAANEKQMALEDRLAAHTRQGLLDMQNQESRSLEDALNRKKLNAPDVREVGGNLVDLTDLKTPKVVFQQQPKLTAVNWQTVEGKDGFYHQINPQTGEDRPTRVPIPDKPTNPVTQEQNQFRRSQALGQDYRNNPLVKNAFDLANVAAGIKAGAAGGTGIDDLSLIYQTVKLFDPNSAVREGEISLFQKAQSLPNQLRTLVARWNKGRLLTPEMRQQITQLVDAKIAESETGIQPVQRDFGEMARRHGVSSDSAFIAPSPFRGIRAGQPADPAEWLRQYRSRPPGQ